MRRVIPGMLAMLALVFSSVGAGTALALHEDGHDIGLTAWEVNGDEVPNREDGLAADALDVDVIDGDRVQYLTRVRSEAAEVEVQLSFVSPGLAYVLDSAEGGSCGEPDEPTAGSFTLDCTIEVTEGTGDLLTTFEVTGTTDEACVADGDDVVTLDVAGLDQTATISLNLCEIFTDIDGHMFFSEIMWAWENDITEGCADGRFCPDDTVNREQMASFLVRALDIPSSSQDFFTDDEASIHEGDINALAAAGITVGCGGTNYCPLDPTNREQMASFLVRAFEYPFSPTDFFTDDELSIHEGDINRLAQAEVTTGCGGTNYCPLGPVTRGQMVAFLHRAMT